VSVQAAYDFAPALELMLLGLLLALLPLGWVWRRQRHSAAAGRIKALAVLTLFLTFDLVLFGAFTRLTDSGLGCPDWPGCYGKASPLGAQAQITQAEQVMPHGPVTYTKAWIEMLHRYLASMVGVLTIALSWMAVRHRTLLNPCWPVLALLWVCVQGAFGAWTVTMKLFPAIVVLHLLGGSILLALLCVSAVRAGEPQRVALHAGLRRALWLVLALVLAQSALGGWVSANYAVLACTDFPTCQGRWWPTMHFGEALQIWRPLGQLRDGTYISFEALTAIHYMHRLGAYLVAAALLALLWPLKGIRALAVQRRWLATLLAVQAATGISNVVLGWPLLAAVLHTGGAAALVLVLVWCLAASRSAALPVPATLAHDADRGIRHA